jgi:hypothetical protein
MKKIYFKIFCYKKSKKKRKSFLKFVRGRGSKSLPLSFFLAEKMEPNYDTAYNHTKFPEIPASQSKDIIFERPAVMELIIIIR